MIGTALANEHSDEDLSDFVAECRELLDDVSDDLMSWQQAVDPTGDCDSAIDEQSVNALYRTLHTIKGTAQLFGFHQLSQLSQALEGALEPVRDRTLHMPHALPAHLIKATDVVSRLLDSIEARNPLDGFDRQVTDLVIECTAIMVVSFRAGFVLAIEPFCTSSHLDASSKVSASGEDVRNHDALPETTSPAPSPKPTPCPTARPVHKPAQPSIRNVRASEEKVGHSADTIRVQVSLLDQFMNLVGELVLTKNQLTELARSSQMLKLREHSRDLSQVTSELQFLAMKTRLQPVGNVLSKFHRVVRELSRDLDKDVEFQLLGAHTELDRTLVESIRDPITHIVRNALDHGIELPVERIAAGKKDQARVTIEAYYENGQVIIAVRDNGRGINVDAIRAKVAEKEWLSALEAQRSSDAEIIPYIFEPGFSTNHTVNALSGRGVGMDVVKNNIEAIGGRVEVDTIKGEKTEFRLRIPLTMAIVTVMIVSVGGRPFAVPGANIQEMLQIQLKAPTALDRVGETPVYKLRGKLLPIVTLEALLGLTPQSPEALTEAPIDSVVVVNSGNTVFGIAVDHVVESLDLVVKPLHPSIKQSGHFSGAAVLGDGKIALTLDVTGLAHYAQIEGAAYQEKNTMPRAAHDLEATYRDYLITSMGGARKVAFMLSQVYRLERIDTQKLNFVNSVAYYTYGRKRIKIFDIRKELGIPEPLPDLSREVEFEVVMCKKNTTYFGILVERIEDTYRTAEGFDQGWFDVPGIVGNLIIADETVVVVEPANLSCVTANSSLLGAFTEAPTVPSGNQSLRVLVVEDSQFFRNQVKKVLMAEGISCEVAEDGVEALKILSEPQDPSGAFHAIISDIEMPRMDGLELARHIRSSASLKDLPLIAMTTRFRAKDQQAGYEAGFDRYLEKLNGEQLVTTLHEFTGG